MSSTGRRKDIVWLNFDEVKDDKRKGCRAKCKKCKKEMEGQVVRMKKHVKICCNIDLHSDNESIDGDPVSLSSASSSLDSARIQANQSEIRPQKRKRDNKTLDSFVSKSTPAQKQIFDEQIARFIYATNTPFLTVEHPEFIKMVQTLRPEYFPPNRKQIAGDLLENSYRKEKVKCIEILKNEIVTLALDGWSNIHNEPVICITLTTKDGSTYLVDTIDTSGISHTSENLYDMVVNTINKCQSDFQCLIHAVVTDNTGNVEKMRRMLDETEDENLSIVTYGCAAHILNLLAGDISYPNVKEQILHVIKYFRNNHFANACFRKVPDAPKLILPSEVRWNSFSDALEKYLKSWPILVNICESNKDEIEKSIQSSVLNISLKRNAEHYFEQLKPISVALDRAQRENCSIGETVFIFKELKKEMQDKNFSKDVLEKVDNRYQMAITPAHLLAYLLHPKAEDADAEDDHELSKDEKKVALEYAKKKFPKNNLLTLTMKFCAKSSPFQRYLFQKEFINNVTAVEWWRMQENDIRKFNAEVLKEVEIILTAKATTANVERIFSSFGIVQSKLRNRLGLEKAAKLVFLFKMLNPNSVLFD